MGQGVDLSASYSRHGEFECELTRAALPAFIAQLNQTGGHLLTVKPAVSLESVFFKILAAARQHSPYCRDGWRPPGFCRMWRAAQA
jgi:ABC-2 type transport system ATP-binding protein